MDYRQLGYVSVESEAIIYLSYVLSYPSSRDLWPVYATVSLFYSHNNPAR